MFPSHYPHDCPPQDAYPPDGKSLYCRLVDLPITEQALESQYEKGQRSPNTCSEKAVSFSTKIKGLQRLTSGYSWAKNMAIAWFCPPSDCGLLRIGKKKGAAGSHVDLWLFENTRRSDLVKHFTVDGAHNASA